MTHPQFFKKLIWAVDAFEETNEIQLHTIETLKLFANMIQTQVQPVYVLNPDQLDIPMELSQPFLDRYEISAKKSLEHILRKADINGLLPPKILIHQKTSLRGATQALLSYAMSVSASAIVVGSHGRSGLERFFLGSFSESLTLQSKLPVLIVGTKTKTQNDIKEILFPTDFAENSFEVFLKVVKLATELNAKIFLLHIIPNPIEPVVQSGIYLLGGGWVPVAAYKEKEEEKQRKIAEQWMSWAIEH
ncbi:MAG: universal stress protein, partial [Bdellovibrio sp.]|nr:universal stress protein [Bdellovibrio sp.]